MVNLHLEALDWIESLTLHACVVAVGCVLVFRGRITETALGAVVVISGLCIWTQHVAVFGAVVLMFVSSSVHACGREQEEEAAQRAP
jgi:threonine/homoserine/homoserine lactone efflux protein